MRIDDFSLAFNCTGCPSWGTAIVIQDKEKTHLIKNEIVSNILIGMVRKCVTINTHNFSLPIGKGSRIFYGDTGFDNATSEPMLVSVFYEVYINKIRINAPFVICIIRDRAKDHEGRLQLKYTPKLKYGEISNNDFFKVAVETLNISEGTPWMIYDIEVVDQEELHFKALVDDTEEKLKVRLNELPVMDALQEVKKESYQDLEQILQRLIEIPQIPFSISSIIQYIKETGLLYTDNLIKRFAFSLMAKRFLILSGLAGSGKTQLALAFANALIEDEKQLCVVSVGADWTNREPLLGFPNALQANEYVKPESGVLDILMEANKEENKNKPYFLVLDEMNMSYVERYFADFLSAMESGEGISLWNGESDVPAKISLPQNLFIIGTINVDETTYMFSPKVLDRANVIEFKISPEEMGEFLKEMKTVNRCSINGKAAGMGASFVELASLKELDKDDEAIQALKEFFDELKKVNAEFGYRTATEIFRYIAQAKKNDDSEKKMTIDEIIDSAIIQKLLPKLHGSRKKLEPVLNQLWKQCFKKEERDVVQMERECIAKAKYKESADKIFRMYEAANANGFTSFAEA